MKFTATAKWLVYAGALAKSYAWKVYIKKTTSLSEDLSVGTWIDVTDFVSFDSWPDIGTKLEYQLGQPVTDGIRIETKNLQWWRNNIWNATASENLEIKVIFQLGLAKDVCTDEAIVFSGFIDKVGRTEDAVEGTTAFNAYTAQDGAARLAGENLTAQYVNPDIDGVGTDGLIMPDIPYLYVKDANIADYVLQPGLHTINYDWNSGSPQVNLDGGLWVALNNAADTTIGNGASAPADTQRVTLYAPDTANLSVRDPNQLADYVVVVTAGETLPRQWHRNIGCMALLNKIFDLMGITTRTYDTMEMSSATGAAKISFLDAPPNDDTNYRPKYATVSDGTDLYIGVGNRLYKRTMATGAYALKATLAVDYTIVKLWHNAANGHVWGLAREIVGNGLSAAEAFRFTIADDSLDEVSIPKCGENCAELYDFTTSGDVEEYAFFYINWNIAFGAPSNSGDVKRIDGASMAHTTLFTYTALGYGGSTGADGQFLYQDDDRIVFSVLNGSSSYLHQISIDPDGTWVTDGPLGITPPTINYEIAAWHSTEARIYYWEPSAMKIKSFLESTGTAVDVLTLGTDDGPGMMREKNGAIYVTTKLNGHLYSIAANVATQLHEGGGVLPFPSTAKRVRIFSAWFGFEYLGGRIYGLDEAGRLWQFHTTVQFYVKLGDFSGGSVLDAYNRTLQAFALLANVSSVKAARIYRRGNASGTPQTSGNTLSVTIDEASQVVESDEDYAAAFELVEVTNGVVTYSYDGTNFNTAVLSDARKLSINNALIPDEIVQDVCYHLYQFFKTARVLDTIDLGQYPMLQFEPFDEASVVFTGTLARTGSGPIYGTTVSKDGSLQIEVLI